MSALQQFMSGNLGRTLLKPFGVGIGSSQEVISRNWLSELDGAIAVHRPDLTCAGTSCDSEGPSTVDYACFEHLIELEKKRCDRSNSPFMLVQIHGLNTTSLVKCVHASMTSEIRETDLMGWYADGATLGILFTNIGQSTDDVAEKLLQRINHAIRGALNNRLTRSISITSDIYQAGAFESEQMSGAGFDNEGTFGLNGFSFPRPPAMQAATVSGD